MDKDNYRIISITEAETIALWIYNTPSIYSMKTHRAINIALNAIGFEADVRDVEEWCWFMKSHDRIYSELDKLRFRPDIEAVFAQPPEKDNQAELIVQQIEEYLSDDDVE